MHCEGQCSAVFQDGDVAYAIATRLTIVRRGQPTHCIVEKIVCVKCWQKSGNILVESEQWPYIGTRMLKDV